MTSKIGLKKQPKRLDEGFFSKSTLVVAQALLGKIIVHEIYQAGQKTHLSGIISETEAYGGIEDQAAHFYHGRLTPRTAVAYLAGGHAYVYGVYGMHWLLNFSTGSAGKPGAVLIRALVPLSVASPETIKVNGPGKVCAYLKISKSFHGEDITTSAHLWVEDRGISLPAKAIQKTPRIGIDYAGKEWREKPWRFRIAANAPYMI